MRNIAVKKLLHLLDVGEITINSNGNLYRIKKGELTEITTDCRGYKVITVTVDKKQFLIYQHRLVYAYYHGLENLDKHLTINHIDYNKKNNHPNNLEQVTREYNAAHGQFNKENTPDWKNHNCKLNEIIKNNGRWGKWVADKMGVNMNKFKQYTDGKITIPKEKADILSEIFKIEINDLYEDYQYS